MCLHVYTCCYICKFWNQSICACIACMCIHVYTWCCICKFWNQSICACIVCIGIHVYTCVYMCIHVYICRPHIDHIYSFMCWCPQQAWNIPWRGRQPAGPTQDSHGQQPCHFIPRSGTHSHTRFGAPVGAARVGGAKAAPLHSPWALQSQWALDDPVLSPVRADLGRWHCA